MATYWHYAK